MKKERYKLQKNVLIVIKRKWLLFSFFCLCTACSLSLKLLFCRIILFPVHTSTAFYSYQSENVKHFHTFYSLIFKKEKSSLEIIIR